MRLNELVDIVKYVYNDAFKEQPVDTKKTGEYIYEIEYKNEKIKADRSVGNKYRLTFKSPDETIEKFRLYIDEANGFRMYTCDISNFIDLIESQIKNKTKYYKIQ